MKILLAAVNAKYIHSNLAVYSMKAFAGACGNDVELAEFTINQQKDEILKNIYKRKPDVLCFSCYIWNISFVKDLIGDIGKILPDTVIWVGGPEVSYDAERFLGDMPEVFGVMCGEGEETFSELCGYYENSMKEKVSFSDIKGIVYRDKEEIRRNPPRDIMDMDWLVFPYTDISLFEHKIIYYESSRGCPFSCSYCLSSIDKKLRFRSLFLVKKELQFFLDNRVKQVKFVDRTFNCKKTHALEIWKYIKEHDNGVTNFHFEIAADLLDEEEIEVIRTMRPGLIQLEIGVQSTNERTIGEIKRKTDFAEISRKVKAVQEGKNVHQHLDLIAGLPYEDYESFRQSFNDVYALRPQQLQLGFLKVLKGSYMHEMAETYQCVYKAREPYEVLHTKWLSYYEVCRLKGVEDMVEVYYNSSQFLRTMEALEPCFEDAFSMYEALADFYERHELFGLSHARIRRYEILREFIRERQIDEPEYFDELMIFDLYARENMKTRPSWAGAQIKHKTQKMTHLELFSYDVLGGKKERGSYPVLFDYTRRNPLTYDAAVAAAGLENDDE